MCSQHKSYRDPKVSIDNQEASRRRENLSWAPQRSIWVKKCQLIGGSSQAQQNEYNFLFKKFLK